MIRLRKPSQNIEFTGDVERIVRVAKEHGYDVSSSDAAWAWEQHSESYAAGWLFLPERDNEIVGTLKYYLEAEE